MDDDQRKTRIQFDSGPVERENLARVQELLDARSGREAFSRALKIARLLLEETKNGNTINVTRPDGTSVTLLILY